MTLKFQNKTLDISKAHVNVDLNWRERAGYDLPAMKSDILRDGRITESLHVLHPDDCTKFQIVENTVLRGNRRTMSGQEIVADKDSPAGVVESLRKVPIIYVSGFEDLKEIEAYMLDHGSSKPLSRTEVVHAVWRLQRNMLSEAEIAERLYQLLARYTGNMKKCSEIAQITDSKARKSALVKWLHGTLGNFLMTVNGMGEVLKTALTLTSHKEDSILSETEAKALTFLVTRGRVTELSAAKTKDKSTGEWTPLDDVAITRDSDGKVVTIKFTGGGPTFNEKVEQFIREDSGEDGGNKPRPTAKVLETLADTMKSQAVRTALLAAAGKKGEELSNLDETASRNEKVVAILKQHADRLNAAPTTKVELTYGKLAELLNTIAVSSPSTVDGYLKAI